MPRKPTRPEPVGRFRFTPWGRPMIAILDAELTWTVVPVAADGSAEEQKIVAAMAASLNGLYGEQAARVLLSGVRGVKYVRLFHEAYGDLHGTDGELLKPPPDPPGTIH